MEQIQVNGAPATETFANAAGGLVAYGRAGRQGGYIVETVEGMRRKFADLDSATRWLGASAAQVPEPKPEPKSKK